MFHELYNNYEATVRNRGETVLGPACSCKMQVHHHSYVELSSKTEREKIVIQNCSKLKAYG